MRRFARSQRRERCGLCQPSHAKTCVPVARQARHGHKIIAPFTLVYRFARLLSQSRFLELKGRSQRGAYVKIRSNGPETRRNCADPCGKVSHSGAATWEHGRCVSKQRGATRPARSALRRDVPYDLDTRHARCHAARARDPHQASHPASRQGKEEAADRRLRWRGFFRVISVQLHAILGLFLLCRPLKHSHTRTHTLFCSICL